MALKQEPVLAKGSCRSENFAGVENPGRVESMLHRAMHLQDSWAEFPGETWPLEQSHTVLTRHRATQFKGVCDSRERGLPARRE
ncbi:hypothetical protein GCM10010145_67740 [Streptomyces ruber]|uniref:Uncharacterized protein n=2 Tax=Streptomyces TaxID=1883 RepID=A0A918F0G4_9ACTN|nr:hypothetical protein GCM10010145_67740 [Streptomyces ruber]